MMDLQMIDTKVILSLFIFYVYVKGRHKYTFENMYKEDKKYFNGR